MQEEELFKIWVGLFMNWLTSKSDSKIKIYVHSIFVLSLAYYEFNFALNLPRTMVKF